jgi:hypothetical protein
MKTTITFNGRTFIEKDNTNIQLVRCKCKCSNKLIIPLGVLTLKLIEDCGHCNTDYPQSNHCQMLTNSYTDLISEGGIVCLD